MSVSVEIASVAFKILGNLVGAHLKENSVPKARNEGDVLESIEAHLEEVVAWSSHVQFFGMSSPASVQSSTIALDISSEPRRFRDARQHNEIRTERDVLRLPSHNILLGEPGSGKTTTLKRLAHILLVEPSQSSEDNLDFPLVIRLRELFEGESLFNRFAKIFDLRYSQQEIVTKIESVVKGASSKEIRHIENRVGERRLEDVVLDCLNNTKALVLLDGLDEVRSGDEAQIRAELMQLARRLREAKLIVTCRTGDFTTQMEGFSLLEICPLTELQITSIMTRWLGERISNFLEEIKRLPYYDLTDRPLLLTQLLLLYRRYGYLPEQPAMIYRKVVRLLLEEWDAEREIARTSKYAGFDPDRKAEFLAALSYHLTYCLKEKSFTEDDLAQAYLAIYRPFNLPASQARDVAREIQTHTGIIMAGPRDTYEFCHLSLQEYLCANFVVRCVPVKRIANHMAAYSAPLAVAVTLSAKPGDWLASLILEPGNLQELGAAGLTSLFSRLIIERPFFEISEPLGFAVFRLMHIVQEVRLRKLLCEFLKIETVISSVAKALRWYVMSYNSGDGNGMVRLRLRKGVDSTLYQMEAPSLGAFPGWLLPSVLERSQGRLEFESQPGRVKALTASLANQISRECRASM